MNEERISDTSKYLMIGTALFFDVMQGVVGLFHVIPGAGNGFAFILGYALSILALLTFFTWFTAKGVNFFRGRKAGRRALMWISEYIPVINSLPVPGWTLYTWYTIRLTQKEDREKLEKQKSSLRLVKSARDEKGRKLKKAA